MLDSTVDDWSFAEIAPGHFRLSCDHWDEHTCAEVDFTAMTYSMRFQRFHEVIDEWDTRLRHLKRSGSNWMTCLSVADQADAATELEQKIDLLRDRLAEFAGRIPVEDITRYTAALAAMRAELAELRSGPRWTVLEDYEQRMVANLYARFSGSAA